MQYRAILPHLATPASSECSACCAAGRPNPSHRLMEPVIDLSLVESSGGNGSEIVHSRAQRKRPRSPSALVEEVDLSREPGECLLRGKCWQCRRFSPCHLTRRGLGACAWSRSDACGSRCSAAAWAAAVGRHRGSQGCGSQDPRPCTPNSCNSGRPFPGVCLRINWMSCIAW